MSARTRKRATTAQRQDRRVPARRIPVWLVAAAVVALFAVAVGLYAFGVIGAGGSAAPVSPEGRISFLRSSEDGTKRDLFIVNPDGKGQVQVTKDLFIWGATVWSPDGRYVLAQANVGGLSELVRISLDRANRAAETVSLTADVEADSAFPAWSPDGKLIAFQHKGSGGFQLYVMDENGGGKRQVSGGTGYASQPAWSPDSKRIAYIAGDSPDVGVAKEVYVADAAGGEPRKITSAGKDISRPAWSPDGNSLIYTERVTDRNGIVILVPAEGGEARKLGDTAWSATPQFSPDGSKVLTYNVVPPDGSDVYLLPAAGGDAVNLTANTPEDYVPVWSPDGAKIAWASIQPGARGHKIVVANADGSGVTAVSTGDGDDYQPAWVAAATSTPTP